MLVVVFLQCKKREGILLNAFSLVRVTRLELVRQRHTPLKRACLPIPAHSHMQYWVARDRFNAVYYSIDRQESQALFDRFGENIPLLP